MKTFLTIILLFISMEVYSQNSRLFLDKGFLYCPDTLVFNPLFQFMPFAGKEIIYEEGFRTYKIVFSPDRRVENFEMFKDNKTMGEYKYTYDEKGYLTLVEIYDTERLIEKQNWILDETNQVNYWESDKEANYHYYADHRLVKSVRKASGMMIEYRFEYSSDLLSEITIYQNNSLWRTIKFSYQDSTETMEEVDHRTFVKITFIYENYLPVKKIISQTKISQARISGTAKVNNKFDGDKMTTVVSDRLDYPYKITVIPY